MFHFLGLILVMASWAGCGYLVTKWHDKDLRTISKHAASNKQAGRLFMVILIGLGLMFYWWLMRWFVPHLQLGLLFQVLLTIAIAGQIMTALAPDTQGLSRRIHRVSAWTMAVLFMPLAILITLSSELSLFAQVVCAALVLYMLGGIVLVAFMGKAKSKYLLFQASYVVAFQLVILAGAYLG